MPSWRAILHFPALAVLIAAAPTAKAGEPRAVIELFTSQGCSSCPPADELFEKMAGEPDVITLSLPVDYWDRLGWKDTFAKHAFTERQKAYAVTRNDAQVYTPQAVVNGTQHAVGSQRSAIDRAIANSSANLRVPVSAKRTGDDIIVSIGAAGDNAGGRGTVVLMPILGAREVAIGRGENARRKVTYTNIVRDIVPLGEWNGRALDLKVPAAQFAGHDGVVVLLQSGTIDRPGAILGAARTTLR